MYNEKLLQSQLPSYTIFDCELYVTRRHPSDYEVQIPHPIEKAEMEKINVCLLACGRIGTCSHNLGF